MTEQQSGLRAELRDGRWQLAGAADGELINGYLGYLADRGFSAHTVRAYAFDLLAFARWLDAEGITLAGVSTDVMLRFLAWCRTAPLPGRPGGNVYSIRDGRSTGFAPATINRRLAAVAGLFGYWAMRDPAAPDPLPRGAAARRAAAGERGGLLAHLGKPKRRSGLRVREPRRLPRGLDQAETTALLGSFRTDRDRAIAGLMLFCGLRSAEVLGLAVGDVDIPRGWIRVMGKGGKERRVPLDPDVAGLIQAYLLAGRPETSSRALFVVAKGPNRGQPLTPAGLRTIFRYHRGRAGVPAGHPHALRHSFGTALAEAGVDLAVLQALMGHDHVDSSAAYIHLAPAHVRAAYVPPASASAPCDAPRRLSPGDLPGGYQAALASRGAGNKAFWSAARAFVARWPDPQAWAGEPLAVRLSASSSARPFLNYLMLSGQLHPGYDYLLARKLPAVLREAPDGPLGEDRARFLAAAAELGWQPRVAAGLCSQIAMRLLIQAGPPLTGITDADIAAFDAAITARERARGRPLKHYRDALYTSRTVIYHMGAPVRPVARKSTFHLRWPWARHFDGAAPGIGRSLTAYLECASGTRVRATVLAMAGLGHFARFLAACDPALDSLAALDRQRHIEPWLAAVAAARNPRTGTILSASERRSRVLTVGRMIDDIIEWGWAEAPARRLIFARDVPRLPRALPRYLPADADRALAAALRASPSPLPAAALLLLRATGMRIGELLDLELDCVHEVPGAGAWLKVPLGKLDTERMVPIDEEALALVDQITEHRSPGRPLPHPRTGKLADFLLTHQGRRVSADTLRGELHRAAAQAGIGAATPHQLRHTYATALVNSGCSLQALMALLGHVSAEMSLRYGRLFDATVRDEYERALDLAKAQLGPVLPGERTQLPLAAITGGNWQDTPLIKSRLAGGYCLRTATQGPCAYANICEHYPNFRSGTGFLPVLQLQRADAETLAADAAARGWGDEAARHRRLIERLDLLIAQAHAS